MKAVRIHLTRSECGELINFVRGDLVCMPEDDPIRKELEIILAKIKKSLVSSEYD